MKNFIYTVKNVLNDKDLKQFIKTSSSVVQAVQPFVEKQNAWSAMRAGLGVIKVFFDENEIYPFDYFNDNGWVELFHRNFNGSIIGATQSYARTTCKTASEGYYIVVVDLGDDISLGYMINSVKNSQRVDRIYIKANDINQAQKKIRGILWKHYDNKHLVMRKNPLSSVMFDEDRVVLETDNSFLSLPSQKATQYSDYLKKYIDAGINRSVMLYGPPGTGKSTLTRKLVDLLDMKSFRVRIEDVNLIDTATLFEAIQIFEPEAIILDDFDRCASQDSLLEMMEQFSKNVKLVIATVNNRDNFDEALLRPGRFDELVLIDKMDEDVVKTVLGEKNIDAFETVKDWPIAFIQELVKRRTFMSNQDAEEGIIELAERVTRLKALNDNVNDISSIIKKKRPATMVEGGTRKRKKFNNLKKTN